MNWLDVVLAAVLAWSVFTGFRKGLVREVIALTSVVAALLLAIWLYGTAASFLLPYISSRPAANLAGFLFGVLRRDPAGGDRERDRAKVFEG